ncbi:MAG: hypothetical protein FWG99_11145 [Treponema sp.]|nr:hypothetical protein [Treponema sp.]
MFFKKPEKDPDSFWREYEEKTGEKVLARSLGMYVSGWEEFDNKGWSNIWGLIIATGGGFRFHHFPQYSWLDFLSRAANQDKKEKTIFIPKEKIVSAVLIKETKWWRKILNFSPPKLVVSYMDETGNERRVFLDADYKSDDIAPKLSALLPAQ